VRVFLSSGGENCVQHVIHAGAPVWQIQAEGFSELAGLQQGIEGTGSRCGVFRRWDGKDRFGGGGELFSRIERPLDDMPGQLVPTGLAARREMIETQGECFPSPSQVACRDVRCGVRQERGAGGGSALVGNDPQLGSLGG